MDLSFPWHTLAAIVAGRSAVDIPRLYVRTEEEAEAFVRRYGFDWDEPLDRAAVERIRQEAVGFLENDILADEPDMMIDPEVREESDVRRLIVWASDRSRSSIQRWSCVVLRVMHTLAHSTSYLYARFGAEIREQILEQFEPHVRRDGGRLTLGTGDEEIPLVAVELKREKSRRSTMIKLLLKPENVAAEIHDWVGVRIVTEDKLDAVLVVRYLRRHNVVVFANVMPHRSRNTLVDIETLRAVCEDLEADPSLPEPERTRELRRRVEALPSPRLPEVNPHSAKEYHSIQFTCRQLIRVKEDGHHGPDLFAGEDRFFFPYEVQIMDRTSFESSHSGDASYDDYKRRQLSTVKRRLLGSFLDD